MAGPSGRRSCVNVPPELRSRARASRRRRELLHASPECHDFLAQFRCAHVRHVQAYHDLRCCAEPPTSGRPRDAEIGGDSQVPGALDEIPKPVVVALLRAPRGRHGDDHRPFGHVAQLLEGHGGPSADVRWSAAVTRTRAGKCRMSLGTAPVIPDGSQIYGDSGERGHYRCRSALRGLVRIARNE